MELTEIVLTGVFGFLILLGVIMLLVMPSIGRKKDRKIESEPEETPESESVVALEKESLESLISEVETSSEETSTEETRKAVE